MKQSNDEDEECSARQENVLATDTDEEATLEDVFVEVDQEFMLMNAAETTEGSAAALNKPKPPQPTNDAERADILKKLMYQVSEENLNLANCEPDPRLRQAFVQTGLSAATGWIRMSDLCEKLHAKTKAESR